MKCIVGLGNIGKRFERTRHNIGFEVIDYILDKNQFTLDKQKFKGAYTIERLNGDKVLFIEPMTMMNLSGEAVGPLMDYYNVEVEDLIVLYDDMDLSQGHIRLRQKGSADYVLQKFSNEEMMTMEKVIEHAAQAVEAFIETSRFDHVMNEYNGEVN